MGSFSPVPFCAGTRVPVILNFVIVCVCGGLGFSDAGLCEDIWMWCGVLLVQGPVLFWFSSKFLEEYIVVMGVVLGTMFRWGGCYMCKSI